MNRRGFLASMLAAPVAALAGLRRRRAWVFHAHPTQVAFFRRAAPDTIVIPQRKMMARVRLTKEAIEASRFESGQFWAAQKAALKRGYAIGVAQEIAHLQAADDAALRRLFENLS